ncbi:MAG: hypothetical protein U0R65_02575 [Candidatus Nanopelagicales bacterium]
MVTDGIAVTRHGVEAGMQNPDGRRAAGARGRAHDSVSGALVLHEHPICILAGEDITAELTADSRYLPAVVEILGRLVFAE